MLLENGTLYVCATPIGNLGDITLRVLDTLKEVDFIAAEDTRHSRKLLDHFGIKKTLISYHEHNEKQRSREILRRLQEGQTGALVSDAGLPGISDPGQYLIQQCIAEKVSVDVLPGPNAALTALVLSGLPTEGFLFLGFLPTPKGRRTEVIHTFSKLPYTVILYEAPHRLAKVLEELYHILGERKAVVARELTKLHQSLYRGTLQELVNLFQDSPVKGECCILLAPFQEAVPVGTEEDWMKELSSLVAEGMERKEAMKKVAKKYGMSKRDIYKASLKEDL